jgi:enamine deaminase RidA (YjgF/YER057c/UK114 family)
MKFTGIIAGALALALASSASAQVSAPIYKSANTPLPAQGTFILDATGASLGTPTNPITIKGAAGSPGYTVVTGPNGNQATVANGALTLVSGTLAAINLGTYSGAQIQIAGLSADTLAITQSLDCTNYVTTTVLKHDLSTTAASALTGSGANGIYSAMVFGGCLKITRTGSADTLTVTYRGTN